MYEPMQSCNPNAMYVAMYSLSLSGWLEAPYFLAGLGLYAALLLALAVAASTCAAPRGAWSLRSAAASH